MAFVVSENKVGYFGFISGNDIILFQSPYSEHVTNFNGKPTVLKFSSLKPEATNITVEGTCHKSTTADAQKCEITNACISPCGKWIAACNSAKLLQLWILKEMQWLHLSVRELTRKCIKMLFTYSSNEILVADRSGDVFSFSVIEPNKRGHLVLGHLSVILDLVITPDNINIISCDRDEKIRVSKYPNAYNIQSYCLGHREFVSSLIIICCHSKLLLSGSGDGTLRVWKYDEGKQLYSYLCCNDLHSDSLPEHMSASFSQTEFKGNSNDQCDSNAVVCESINVQTATSTEKQDRCDAVKLLKYCSLNSVIAVLFDTQHKIVLYSLNTSKNNHVTIKFIQLLDIQKMPLDAYFDEKGHLWVLVSCKEQPVILFKTEKKEGKVQYIEPCDNELPESEQIIQELCKNWQHFELSLKLENLYSCLYKQCYDNVKDYLGKKCQQESEKCTAPWKKSKAS